MSAKNKPGADNRLSVFEKSDSISAIFPGAEMEQEGSPSTSARIHLGPFGPTSPNNKGGL